MTASSSSRFWSMNPSRLVANWSSWLGRWIRYQKRQHCRPIVHRRRVDGEQQRLPQLPARLHDVAMDLACMHLVCCDRVLMAILCLYYHIVRMYWAWWDVGPMGHRAPVADKNCHMVNYDTVNLQKYWIAQWVSNLGMRFKRLMWHNFHTL